MPRLADQVAGLYRCKKILPSVVMKMLVSYKKASLNMMVWFWKLVIE